MRTTNHVLYIELAIVAAACLSPQLVAQTASPVLNKLELPKFIASSVPADQARVATHFAAMADRHDSEASRHRTMSKAAAGNPSRQLSTSMSVHCTRLADLSTQAASTLRELAAHHTKLAAGQPSIVPKDAARYQSGEGARVPTEKELAALAAKARTVADHRALEEYFLTAAKRYKTEAEDHQMLAQTYRGTRLASAAISSDRLAMLARDAAKEATAAATMHGDLAGIAR